MYLHSKCCEYTASEEGNQLYISLHTLPHEIEIRILHPYTIFILINMTSPQPKPRNPLRVNGNEIPLLFTNNRDEPARIFVGSLSAATSLEFHQEFKLTHVLSILSNLDVKFPEDVKVKHFLVNCKDRPTENILQVLPSCMDFLKAAVEENGSILVHCASGVSRSVAVCVAYLMIEQQYTFKDALNLIQSQRMLANPNLGFMKQLRLLETTKGDIQEAIKVHQSQNYDVVEDTLMQRSRANALHVKIDSIENKIAANDHDKILIKEDLIAVHQETINLLGDASHQVDMVAKIVLKSVVSKAERLLETIKDL